MHRWNTHTMQNIGAKLFDKIHKRKFHSHYNHEIHFMAREMDWLPKGIESLANGSYDPRCLKRYYFSDEMVDQLHISDRIFQHILLRILKPTFKFVMNKNCYHLDGPTGVKNATQKIREVLQNANPKYFIRTDIKSFYKSIPQYKLIQDVKKYYDDPKLISMLTNVIKNPIDTPYGYKNPDCGIALRGPLSQFFSGIYLKPLDDAISKMNVTYLRYQDDILILCNTKRQLNRCKRKMMAVLNERHLRISKRKTRVGEINQSGFHFLGIEYLPTRTEDITNTTPVIEKITPNILQSLSDEGGVETFSLQHTQETLRIVHIVPHARTLRKAREQVKMMVVDGVSLCQIKNYLSRWAYWWVRTSSCWNYNELVNRYIDSCWDLNAATIAAWVFQQRVTSLRTDVLFCAIAQEIAA